MNSPFELRHDNDPDQQIASAAEALSDAEAVRCRECRTVLGNPSASGTLHLLDVVAVHLVLDHPSGVFVKLICPNCSYGTRHFGALIVPRSSSRHRYRSSQRQPNR